MKHYTEEELEFVRKNAKGLFIQELTDLFNKHFGKNKSVNYVMHIKKSNKIRSGKIHRSVPGQEKTQFKKGQQGYNHVEVGSRHFRKYRNAKSYWFIKTAEPNKWELLSKVLWEEAYGKLKEDECLLYIDNDPHNCTLENLVKIKRRELPLINREGLTDNRELNETILNRVRLLNILYEHGATGLRKYERKA